MDSVLTAVCSLISQVIVGNPRDYAAYKADCLYYNWNRFRGADSGMGKSAWQWVGGDVGFDCGYAHETAMEAALADQTLAIRISVCTESWRMHVAV